MNPIKTAIIGYGLSGRLFHGMLLTALPTFEVTAIMTKDPQKQKQAKNDFPRAQIVEDEQVIFNDSTIELMIIATPNVDHFRLASKALRAGKHVVVEKPFTVSSMEAATLCHLASDFGKMLSVYQNRRFDGDFLTLQKVLASGQLGRIAHYESHFDRFRPHLKVKAWREDDLPGSGLLFDLGSHLIDQALVLLGRPHAVYCDLQNQRGGAVDDAFSLHLYYDGFKAVLCASSLVKEPTPKFAVYGTNGAYVKYGFDPQESSLRALSEASASPEEIKSTVSDLHFGKESNSAYGVLHVEDQRTIIETERGCYLDYYHGVAHAILENKKPPVTCEEGLAVIEIIEFALMSHAEGRKISI